VIETPSPNFDTRGDAAVDMLVWHYTGMTSADAALQRLCDPEAKVSAHYLIDEDGAVHRLVDEAARAWHAGVAYWRGATDINARSVGIELVNPGHEFGYRPFPEAQIAAALTLGSDIVARHAVPARNVVGHSDVAPTRKTDPGEFFPWPRFAEAGIGLWPEEADMIDQAPDTVDRLLAEVGYETADRAATVRAFQRRFRPERVNGRIDAGTVRRLQGLADMCNTRRSDRK
jgi:N-acetylmuramoyl-L-alanine amidase